MLSFFYKYKNNARDYLQGVSLRHSDMRDPKVCDSLSWGKRKNQNTPGKDAGTMSVTNKFSNDGNFMQEFLHKQGNGAGISSSHTNCDGKMDSNVIASETNKSSRVGIMLKENLSTNQLEAKAL
ncbi:hypothetical protein DITRI_Ditri15bG0092600 [Diplodiscus trichospermus]